MTLITFNCAERIALRGLEFEVLPPQPLWKVLGRIQYHPHGFYVGNFNATQVGQLRAYIRDNMGTGIGLAPLYDRLEAIFQAIEPCYHPRSED